VDTGTRTAVVGNDADAAVVGGSVAAALVAILLLLAVIVLAFRCRRRENVGQAEAAAESPKQHYGDSERSRMPTATAHYSTLSATEV